MLERGDAIERRTGVGNVHHDDRLRIIVDIRKPNTVIARGVNGRQTGPAPPSIKYSSRPKAVLAKTANFSLSA
jgi:hypothetical protein